MKAINYNHYLNNIQMVYPVMMMYYQIQIHYLLKILIQIQEKNKYQEKYNKLLQKVYLMLEAHKCNYKDKELDHLVDENINNNIYNELKNRYF